MKENKSKNCDALHYYCDLKATCWWDQYIMHYAVERPADSECIAWYTLQETISHCEIYDSEVGLVSL